MYRSQEEYINDMFEHFEGINNKINEMKYNKRQYSSRGRFACYIFQREYGKQTVKKRICGNLAKECAVEDFGEDSYRRFVGTKKGSISLQYFFVFAIELNMNFHEVMYFSMIQNLNFFNNTGKNEDIIFEYINVLLEKLKYTPKEDRFLVAEELRQSKKQYCKVIPQLYY